MLYLAVDTAALVLLSECGTGAVLHLPCRQNSSHFVALITLLVGFTIQFNIYTPRGCTFMKGELSISIETQFKPLNTDVRNRYAELI